MYKHLCYFKNPSSLPTESPLRNNPSCHPLCIPWWPLSYLLSPWTYLIQIFDVSRILHHLTFCLWLSSLSTFWSHLWYSIFQNIILVYCWIIFHCVLPAILCLTFICCLTFGLLTVLASASNAVMNTDIWVSVFYALLSIILGISLAVELLVMCSFMFHFGGLSKLFPRWLYHFTFPPAMQGSSNYCRSQPTISSCPCGFLKPS